jgi:hypothetical protein
VPGDLEALKYQTEKGITGLFPASKAELRATNARLKAELVEVRAEQAQENKFLQAVIDKVNSLTPVRNHEMCSILLSCLTLAIAQLVLNQCIVLSASHYIMGSTQPAEGNLTYVLLSQGFNGTNGLNGPTGTTAPPFP